MFFYEAVRAELEQESKKGRGERARGSREELRVQAAKMAELSRDKALGEGKPRHRALQDGLQGDLEIYNLLK